MDKIKQILTLIAIILGALAVLAAIGFVYNLIGYVLLLGVVCIGGYVVYKLFSQSDKNQISAPDPKRELEKVQRVLDEYKRK